VLLSVGFEAEEGYRSGLPLAGQKGWARGKWPGQLESGGQGIATGLFGGSAQQAFIGGEAGATVPAVHASVSRALVYAPSPGREVVEIGWRQQVSASNNGVGNLFEWVFYNQAGQLLCGVIFDNSNGRVARRMADNSIAPTPLKFTQSDPFDVKVRIDFGRNLWSGSIGPDALSPVPIAPLNRVGNLGGMAVTWRSVAAHARTTGGPVAGDNQLAFDDFVVTAPRD
jgi:hypothetical protein